MIRWVNLAKGIAILLVVYGHVIDGLYESGNRFITYDIQHNIIYGFHMPLFFFISGLFLNNLLQRRFIEVLKSRAFSLLYPYFLWGVIQGSIMALLSKFTNGGLSWDRILLLPIDPFGQFWYLYDLFFMIILFYIFNKVFKKRSFILLVMIILFMLSPFMIEWELSRIFSHFPFLVLGSLFFNEEEKFHKYQLYVIGAVIIALILGRNVALLKFLASGILGIVLTIIVSKNIKERTVAEKILFKLGKNSLSIYLWHVLVVAGLRIILTRFIGFNHVPTLIIVLTLLGIVVPLIVDYMIKKLKINNIVYGKWRA